MYLIYFKLFFESNEDFLGSLLTNFSLTMFKRDSELKGIASTMLVVAFRNDSVCESIAPPVMKMNLDASSGR